MAMALHHRTLVPLTLSLLLVGNASSCQSTNTDQSEDSQGEAPNSEGVAPGSEKSGDADGSPDVELPDGGPSALPGPGAGGGGGGGGAGDPDCGGDAQCFPLDILFVIDNSGTMGEEQKNLAANFSKLVDKLKDIKNANGSKAHPLVNMMVTTTDMGHPICTPYEPKGYDPRMGSPVNTTCIERIKDFTGLVAPGSDEKPDKFNDACEDHCEGEDFFPKGDFISFGPGGKSSNVPDDDIARALSCIGPQGVNGCGYESPLEAMMQALNWNKPWNQGKKPFLRKNALLAVVIVTDEADCSVRRHKDPKKSGFEWFTNAEKNEFSEVDPASGKKKPSSAICWNGGVECSGLDGDVYESCVAKNLPSDKDAVLHPVSRYTDLLDTLKARYNDNVVMLGILGVPLVTKHNDKAPFEPIEGGVHALEYRKWRASDLPDGAGEDELAKKQFEFGIGPGCQGDGTGLGIPPVRIKEVCEHLNEKDKDGKIAKVRCCIESICDPDFSNAVRCLSGLIETVEPPK